MDAPSLPPAVALFAKPVGYAVLFSLGLFWLMYFLITGGETGLHKSETVPTVDFLRLAKNFEVDTRERKPPKPPDKPEAPPEVTTPQASLQAPSDMDTTIDMSLANTTDVRSFGLSGEGEYLPIVKVNPIYPPRAQSRGQEGWVLLEFTVTETGAVTDPVVIEAEPAGVFDEAAKRAVVKFKYKPRIVDGKPVRVPNVQHLISFKIEK